MGAEWPTETIESLLRSGALLGHQDGNHGSQYPRIEEFGTVGVPFLTAKLIEGGRIDISTAPRLAAERANELRVGFAQPGDVVLSHNATIGRVAILPDYEGRILLGTSLTYFRVNHARLLARYLAAFFSGRDFQDQLRAVMSHTTRNQVPITAQRKLKIVVPPLAEQRAIARILGALDEKIELHRKMNATLEAMTRALFKSWFVDFDPVRVKAEGRAPSGMDAETATLFPREFVQSDFGDLPAGWSAVPVYDIAKYVNGAAYKAFEPNNERRGLPIIKIAELKAGVTTQTKFSDIAMPEKYRLRTGDILFSWSGNPDTSIDTFVWAHGEAWLNQHIFRVDLYGPDERSFVLATLKYLRPAFAEIARNKQTTGLGHVTAGDMQRLLVVKPDMQVVAAWERVAAPIFEAIFHNELESLSLGRLRDELLPRLLSGELSATALDDAIVEVAI
jgi:type I restriction enzyme S subunit